MIYFSIHYVFGSIDYFFQNYNWKNAGYGKVSVKKRSLRKTFEKIIYF